MCGAAGRRALVARDRNRETSDARFVYDRCTTCATVFLTNAPTDLANYYRGSYYGFRPEGEPDWRKGAIQAKRHRSFANRVYLALSSDYVHRVQLEVLQRHGIGRTAPVGGFSRTECRVRRRARPHGAAWQSRRLARD